MSQAEAGSLKIEAAAQRLKSMFADLEKARAEVYAVMTWPIANEVRELRCRGVAHAEIGAALRYKLAGVDSSQYNDRVIGYYFCEAAARAHGENSEEEGPWVQ